MKNEVASERSETLERGTTLRMKALLKNVPRALECVGKWAEEAGFDERALYEIQLAVDEACANVVDHAYQEVEAGDIEVSCQLDDQVLTVRVRDWGQGFDLGCVADPDLKAPLEERCLGGLGLFLVKQMMDHVEFISDPEQGNELIMRKRLEIAG